MTNKPYSAQLKSNDMTFRNYLSRWVDARLDVRFMAQFIAVYDDTTITVQP